MVIKTRHKDLTQAEKAQVITFAAATQSVRQMIMESLNTKRPGLSKEDLDRIFYDQPVHWEEMGYVPHWFKRPDIENWAMQLWALRFDKKIKTNIGV